MTSSMPAPHHWSRRSPLLHRNRFDLPLNLRVSRHLGSEPLVLPVMAQGRGLVGLHAQTCRSETPVDHCFDGDHRAPDSRLCRPFLVGVELERLQTKMAMPCHRRTPYWACVAAWPVLRPSRPGPLCCRSRIALHSE